jgi:hypothetical protein
MTIPMIIGTIFVVILIGLFLKAILRTVLHEERLVIYRLGHFHRVAGPGMVIVLPHLDRVIKTIRVRDQPVEVTVDGLFPFGVPIGMTLNLWYRYDPVKAAGGNHARLADLVQLTESERSKQVEVKVREALVRQIAELQQSWPLEDNATIRDQLAALAPGTPRYNKLLEAVRQELQHTLPFVGAVLNPDQTIALTKRDIPPDVIDALGRLRGRQIDSDWLADYADILRQRFPGLSEAVIAQILSAIEGVDVGRLQRILLEQGSDVAAEVEHEIARDGEGPNVITRPVPKQREAQARRARARPPVQKGPVSGGPEVLTTEDLSVLKRVPRQGRDEQLGA